MSKISYITRKTKANGEVSVNVRHTHNGSDLVKSTGVVVHPDYFDSKTGTVVKLPQAPELTASIQLVAAELRTAARNLDVLKVAQTKEAMQAELARIAQSKERIARVKPQAERILLSMLDVLYSDLAELKELVKLKEAEIKEHELSIGINTTHLVTDYVTAFAESKAKTRAKNTVVGYEYTASVVKQFRPLWEMKDVNGDTLKELVNYMIETGKGKSNLTINDVVTKLKTVMYASAKKLGLDAADIKEFKTGVTRKRNPNTVYLTKEELQDVIDVKLTSEAEIKVRDRFVLMALTGIRFSDSNISPENVIDGELNFYTEKTDTHVIVPISAIVEDILKRYNYNLPTYDRTAYNRTLKRLCGRIASLQHSVEVKSYRGANKPKKKPKAKYSVMSAHIARKTFINLSLIAGVNPVVIAGVVGHSTTNLIMKTYGSKAAGKERIAQLMD